MRRVSSCRRVNSLVVVHKANLTLVHVILHSSVSILTADSLARGFELFRFSLKGNIYLFVPIILILIP